MIEDMEDGLRIGVGVDGWGERDGEKEASSSVPNAGSALAVPPRLTLHA